MAVIDCNNRPDFTIKESRGTGFIYSAHFTESSSLSDLTEAYTANALEDTTPAIEIYGVEETSEALALVYTELLSKDKINSYNNIILSTTSTVEVALNSLPAYSEGSIKVKDVAVVASDRRELFFENQFPAIHERLSLGVINPIEFAEFAKEVSYGSMDSIKNDVNSNKINILKMLNFFLGGVGLSSVLSSICSILSNPFNGLTGIINSALDGIEKVMSLKLGFLSIIEKAKKLLDIGAAIGKLKAFTESFGKGLEGLIDGVKRKVENIIKGINNTVSSLLNGKGIGGLSNFIQNKVRQVKNFFSATNMKNLVENAKDSIGKFANQFKEFSGNAADFILSTMCKVSGAIQSFVEAPMKSLEGVMNSVASSTNELKNVSDTNLKRSIEGGRPSITKDSKDSKIKDWRVAHLAGLTSAAEKRALQVTNPSSNQTNTSNDRSDEFLYVPEKVSHPEPTEWKWLTFGGQVLNPRQAGNVFWEWDTNIDMVDYGGGTVNPSKTGIDNAIGYYGIKLEALERVEALGEALQTKLTITSGYRHQIYNQYLRNTGVGAAISSQHINGKALDVVMGRGRFREKFIQMARVHGFKGIGRYNTFVHIDLGPSRTWGS